MAILRRAANLPLLAIAAALLIYNVPARAVDPLRAGGVLTLVAVGVFCNFAGLILPQFSVRWVVRVVACTILLIGAAGFAVGAAQLAAQEPDVRAQADPQLVASLAAAALRHRWLALALAYVAVSFLVLPPPVRSGGGDPAISSVS